MRNLGPGPEFGLPCELALAEIRVDKALALLQQQHIHQHHNRRKGGCGTCNATGKDSNSSTSGSGVCAGAAPTTPAAVSLGKPAAGTLMAVRVAPVGAEPASAAASSMAEAGIPEKKQDNDKNEGTSAGGGGSGDVSKDGKGSLPSAANPRCAHQSSDARHEKAEQHLSAADRAMLQLEPWCLSIANGGVNEADGVVAGDPNLREGEAWIYVGRRLRI